VSCSGACFGFRIISFQHEARIEATAGLQMSQPRPCALLFDQVGKRADVVELDEVKQLLPRIGEVLAQMVLTATPCFLNSASTMDLASGPQPPQLVAHFVAFFSAPSVVTPPFTAWQI